MVHKEQAEADTDNAPDSTVDEEDLQPKAKVNNITKSIDQIKDYLNIHAIETSVGLPL